MANRKKQVRKPKRSRVDTLDKGEKGSSKTLVESAIALHPKDPLKQLTYFLDDVELKAFTGRKRAVSEATRTKFGQTMFKTIEELSRLGMRVQRIDHISRRQIVQLVVHWLTTEGDKPGTVVNKISILRKFSVIIGKPGTVPPGDELDELLQNEGLPAGCLLREQVIDMSKTWSAQGVDPYAKIEEVRIKHPHEALLLEDMLQWGSRVLEAICNRPHQSDQPGGRSYTRGTKGGRYRFVPYSETPERAKLQRDVMDRCQEYVDRSARKDMGYPGLTLAEARRKFYYVIEQYGITESSLGITCHGLRHEFAANLFEDTTGHRPPAEGQEPPEWFKAHPLLVKEAEKRVSEALGHWRLSISRAYLGSVAKMTKRQKANVEALIALAQGTTGVGAGLLHHGIVRAWLTGRAARGLVMSMDEKIALTVQMRERALVSDLSAAQAAMNAALGGRFVLQLLSEAVEPKDGVEVSLDLNP